MASVPNQQRADASEEVVETCAICGQPSDDLDGEGECPGCVEEREEEEAEP